MSATGKSVSVTKGLSIGRCGVHNGISYDVLRTNTQRLHANRVDGERAQPRVRVDVRPESISMPGTSAQTVAYCC